MYFLSSVSGPMDVHFTKCGVSPPYDFRSFWANVYRICSVPITDCLRIVKS